MRRFAKALALVLAVVIVVWVAGGASNDDGGDAPTYRIELRNAYDLVEGGDFKVKGVPAGSIEKISVDRKTLAALVDVKLTARPDLRLRTDATCTSRPQSLIGEYFVDCDPGRANAELPSDSGRIPLDRTTSTIPQDLVNNILRVPQRERLTLLLNEFGTGLAGRGEDLNDTIRSGLPALRETDEVLGILADQSNELRSLTVNADRVVGELADKRRDVARFVNDAGDAADVTASRRDDLAAGFRRLPAFLGELRQTMDSLDQFATAQTPAVAELERTAKPLEQFLGDLETFSDAAPAGIDALSDASDSGREATKAGLPTVRQLDDATRRMPELSKNLRFILEHIDDRKYGVMKDTRAARQLAAPGPGGDRYTGLESLLQYVFDQGMAVNLFNQNGHYLQLDVIAAGVCSIFADAETVRSNPALEKQCSGNVLGPSSPGIHDPDPGKRPETNKGSGAKQRERLGRARQRELPLEYQAVQAAGIGRGGDRPDPLVDFLLAP